MGLSTGDDNFIYQLRKAGKISRATFSLCFSPDGGKPSRRV